MILKTPLLQIKEVRDMLRRTEGEAREAARTADARQVALETSAATADARVTEVKRRLVAAEGEVQRKAALVQACTRSCTCTYSFAAERPALQHYQATAHLRYVLCSAHAVHTHA